MMQEATIKDDLTSDLAERSVNTIRFLSADGVQQAKSGHPGLPMGMADVAYTLWTRYLNHNPADPTWFNRDRFVLSGGHGSMLLYSLLYLTGYDLPLEELQKFRQWGSKTPGHPEYGETAGVEITTGPLGQGASSSVGMALAEAMLAARYNQPGHEIVDHYTYAIVTDGDLMEGVTSEAASLAGHLGLGKLIWLYDDNHISIDGPTDIAFTENRKKRFEAYDWQTISVDGHNRKAIAKAIAKAQKKTDKPSIILCRTTIGYGTPNKQGTASVHGEPLGEEELNAAKENLGWPLEPRFYVPHDVLESFRQALNLGVSKQAGWDLKFADFAAEHPDMSAQLRRVLENKLPENLDDALPTYGSDVVKATRATSGEVLNALAGLVPELIGGSADLTPSNKTDLKGYSDVVTGDFSGRYIRFGVREHAMGAILNGMALHGGIIPYGGTFFVFSDYMRPSVRLAALMGLQVIYVWTHDGIGVGEDGPTHQPVEHIPSLRAIPNLFILRPADGNETAQAWKLALERKSGPSALLLTRQGLPTFSTAETALGVHKGAYILSDSEASPQIVLTGTGSELQLAVEAGKQLAEKGIAVRIVSFPCWKQFEAQAESYRQEVFPPGVPVVAVEAANPFGWERYADKIIGIDRFGASAPYATVYEKLGITTRAVVDAAKSLL